MTRAEFARSLHEAAMRALALARELVVDCNLIVVDLIAGEIARTAAHSKRT